jgi:hypothetical protein
MGSTTASIRHHVSARSSPRLLAFIGVIGAGKGVAADWVFRTYGPGLKVAWGDALKVEVYDYLVERHGEHGRRLRALLRRLTLRTPELFVPRYPHPQEMPREIERAALRVVPALHAPDDAAKIAWVNDHKKHLRRLLQWWGTEYRRGQDPDYWVMVGIRRIQEAITSTRYGVIISDDCRFQNEVDALRDLGFTVIRIDVDPDVQKARILARDGFFDPVIREHIGEVAQKSFAAHHIIRNDTSIENLESVLDDLVGLSAFAKEPA